jgi:DNA-binding CsgD family transcriptional regulator
MEPSAELRTERGGVDERISRALAGGDLPSSGKPQAELREAVEEALSVAEDEIADLAAESDERLAERCQWLVRLHDLRDELIERHVQRRLATFSRVHETLTRLRAGGDVDAIVRSAPAAACEACGFDRSAIYRVRGGDMLAEAIHVTGDAETAREYLEWSRSNPAPLQEQILESEMVRRRRPMLVHDALHHPSTWKPIVEHYMTYAYVTAPIMPEGRVIGFIHGDKSFQNPQDPVGVDEFDRDVLWAFAEGLGYAIERAQLVERLHRQGHQVKRLIAQTDAVVSQVLETKVELVTGAYEGSTATRTATAIFGGPDSELERLLSRRELEVLALLAGGATNAQIAAKLFVTEGTAKAHVGHILRKLGAGNRVEAAALYLRAREKPSS